MKIFNTYGYSIKDLESFHPSSSTSRIALIKKQVLSWSNRELEKYYQELHNLHNLLVSKGLDFFSKDPEMKKKVLAEIQFQVETKSPTVAEGFVRVIKKEFGKSHSMKVLKVESSTEKSQQKTNDEKLIESNAILPVINEGIDKNEFFLSGEILTEKKDFLVESLLNLYQRKRLILQPDFQRNFVWDKRKSSRLIESVILKFPIPLIYLSEEDDGTYNVIDGQQRLQSIFSFIEEIFPDNTRFRLTGVDKSIISKKFSELNSKIRDDFFIYTLSCIIIRKQSDPLIKFKVFERLNRGSITLNAQEVRNCVYHGKYNELLKKLSQNKDFKFILGFGEKPHPRMKDVEWVLRFASFFHQTHYNYKNTKRFLNCEMENNRDISDKEAERLTIAFKNSVSIIKSVFGKRAFVRYARNPNGDKTGKWEEMKNASLFDVLMFSFAELPRNKVQPHLDKIRESLIVLMTQEDFKDSITTRTNNISMVRKRFKIWLETLDEILGKVESEPRCFTYKIKRKLYNKSKTCAICEQNINDIDDAEVDHKEQYWLGGKTIEKNARLVHRYCNRSRSKFD